MKNKGYGELWEMCKWRIEEKMKEGQSEEETFFLAKG